MHTTLLPLATLLSRSEHNLALLTLNYTPAVHQHVALKRTIRTLTPEAVETLHGCLETTGMDVLRDLHGVYCNEILNCVTAYIHFCVKNIISFREVHCFPNSKPLITSELNELLNKRSKWHGWHKTGTNRIKSEDNRMQGLLEKEKKKLEIKMQLQQTGPVNRSNYSTKSKLRLQLSLLHICNHVRSVNTAVRLFNLGPRKGEVPTIWKTSCPLPVLKKACH